MRGTIPNDYLIFYFLRLFNYEYERYVQIMHKSKIY